jgi:hypothetical protein
METSAMSFNMTSVARWGLGCDPGRARAPSRSIHLERGLPRDQVIHKHTSIYFLPSGADLAWPALFLLSLWSPCLRQGSPSGSAASESDVCYVESEFKLTLGAPQRHCCAPQVVSDCL